MSYGIMKIKNVEMIEITPQVAIKMLSKNEGNRKIAPSTVLKYTKEMLAGEWRETHQGIAIDETGNLIDGQNRLMAVIKSGITIKTTITTYYGDLPTIMLPLDRGKTRSLADICGNGINSKHIGVFNAIKAVYKAYSAIMDANVATSMMNKLSPIFDRIEQTCKISITTSKNITNNAGISRIWGNGVKCAVVTALLDNKPISILRDFKKEIPLKNCCKEYLAWDVEMRESGMGGGAERIITDAETFWGVLTNRTFYHPTNYKKHNECRQEMQEILHQHFEL